MCGEPWVLWCARLGYGRPLVKLRSGQTKNDKIGICCFYAKHAALTSKSTDGLAQNWDNTKWTSTTISPSKFNLFSP